MRRQGGLPLTRCGPGDHDRHALTKIEDKTTVEGDLSQSGLTGDLAGTHVALVIYHRDGVKVATLVPEQPTVVGRAYPADVVVADLSLSRRHARLTWDGSRLHVEDLGSTNGTRVRGEKITEAHLSPGETVMLGAVTASVNVAAAGQSLLRGIDAHDRFLTRIEEEVVRARTFKRPLAVIMLRALTLEEGNLSRWVPRVRGALRPVDRMATYGPGSVLVLMPEIGPQDAYQITGQLVRNGPLGEPPLVAGVANYPMASTADELIDAARQSARRATLESPVQVGGGTAEAELAQVRVVIASPAMREVYDIVRRVAPSAIPVLVYGETGTGKEVIAHAIHRAGPRRDEPMRSVNCGAIPATLIESVLFGHEKGAFTGADRAAPGLFEQADGGTLLLDEVGELSPAVQAALLRVLETKRLMRVGGTEEIEVDVRVLAATHRDLDQMVQAGTFRQDLLYRLNTMVLRIPPLRERTEEIEPLAELFRKEAARADNAPVSAISAGAVQMLLVYAWPGNVRELRNAIERAVVVCRGDTIEIEDLSERIRGPAPSIETAVSQPPPSGDTDFKDRVRVYETDLILDALRRAAGNQTQAARLLRMPLRTLVHKIKTYGIRKLYDATDE